MKWLLSALEEKEDGLRRLSMTRCAVAAFTVVYCVRLWTLEALGWPDAALAFVVLFALPIGKAFRSASPDQVVDAVTSMFGRGDSGTSSSSGRYLSRASLDPPVSHGRPVEDEP